MVGPLSESEISGSGFFIGVQDGEIRIRKGRSDLNGSR